MLAGRRRCRPRRPRALSRARARRPPPCSRSRRAQRAALWPDPGAELLRSHEERQIDLPEYATAPDTPRMAGRARAAALHHRGHSQIFHRPRPRTSSGWYSRTYVRSTGRHPPRRGMARRQLPRRQLPRPAPDDLLGNDPGVAIPAAANTPSGALALELDWATANPALLSAADLVDAAIGYEHLTAWATAQQQVLLAEFHRRPADGTVRPAAMSADPAGESAVRREWAVDEIGLALTLAPSAAAIRDGARRPRRRGPAPHPRPARGRADLPGSGPVDRRHARRVRRRGRRGRAAPGAGAGPRADLGAAAGGAHPGHRRGRARSCQSSPEGAPAAAG